MAVWAGGIEVSLFALMHGYLHGAELPSNASPASYGAGFITASLLMRVAGGAIAASGAFLLISAA